MNELKEAVYKGFSTEGRVVYIIKDKEIFFSGLSSPSTSTSTIYAGERIIEAICKAEGGLAWQDFEFFDIQSHRGYRKKYGDFEIDMLVFEARSVDEPTVAKWRPIEPEALPPEVWQLFLPYINN